MEKRDQMFFALLRSAMTGVDFEATPTEAEWTALFQTARKQSLGGVVYTAVARLDKGQQPPMALALQWLSEAESIRGLNHLLNHEAARLTKLFAEAGRRSAILKGQANARLYPDPFSRQPGDIDIWVEGGEKSVKALLADMHLTSHEDEESYHHVHLATNEQGVVVEVHFRPSSGNFNSTTNRRLQQWLEQEILHTTMVEQGFNVPSVRFALMMQLSHVQRHFLAGGIGLRHICDYYMLLKNSTEEERREVASHLDSFGLRHGAAALMWVLHEVLHLDDGLTLCQPDDYRGKWMLREIMKGGNFGRYAHQNQSFFMGRMGLLTRGFRMMRFDFREMAYRNLSFWAYIIVSIPKRIRRGHWSLVKANERDRLKHGN